MGAIKERPYATMAVAGGLAFAIGALWMVRRQQPQTTTRRCSRDSRHFPTATVWCLCAGAESAIGTRRGRPKAVGARTNCVGILALLRRPEQCADKYHQQDEREVAAQDLRHFQG